MRFKEGKLVKYIDPPREEFTGVMATIIEVDEEDECLRVAILPEYIELDPRLARRKIYKHSWERFAICKRLSESEWTLFQELKSKEVRTPVEEYLLSGLESV
jgi:hypothetical protein